MNKRVMAQWFIFFTQVLVLSLAGVGVYSMSSSYVLAIGIPIMSELLVVMISAWGSGDGET